MRCVILYFVCSVSLLLLLLGCHLSVPVPVIDWKDSSQKWPIIMPTLNSTHSITHLNRVNHRFVVALLVSSGLRRLTDGGFVWMFTTTTTTTTTNDYSDASLKLQGHTYQIDKNDGTVVRSQLYDSWNRWAFVCRREDNSDRRGSPDLCWQTVPRLHIPSARCLNVLIVPICVLIDLCCCMVRAYYLSVIVCFPIMQDSVCKNGWPAR